jgi:Predicted periplasmic solute-binding protein
MSKLKISSVSYLNSKPFVFGLQHSPLRNNFELSLDIPSVCASKLMDNQVDIGLVPVAAIPKISGANIITDYCIASSGKVRTVVLVSESPVEQIERIVLDYQSRTSVRLIKILAKHFWNISPVWVDGAEGYIDNDIHGTTAGVIIGDRVFEHENRFPYLYDLGEIWKVMTGLDFVFACWVANKPVEKELIVQFNEILKFGIENIPQVIDEYQQLYPNYRLDNYFTENIFYVFDESKRKGLELFWKYNENLEL